MYLQKQQAEATRQAARAGGLINSGGGIIHVPFGGGNVSRGGSGERAAIATSPTPGGLFNSGWIVGTSSTSNGGDNNINNTNANANAADTNRTGRDHHTSKFRLHPRRMTEQQVIRVGLPRRAGLRPMTRADGQIVCCS